MRISDWSSDVCSSDLESAVLSGAIVIERGAQILAHSVINGPAYIGCDAVVGNFSLLRRFCFLAKDSLVGNHSYCNEAVVRSEEHTSELQSLMRISYAVFCLKKKKQLLPNNYTLYIHINNKNIYI